MFQKKIHEVLDRRVQFIWVVPHPLDVGTHLRSNLRDSQKDSTFEEVRHARFLTRMLNDTFQQWEGFLRKNSGRLVLLWFTKFVSVTSTGSKKFADFMKAVCAGNKMPSVSIQPLLPEAVVDGFDPSHKSIMRVLSALRGLFDKPIPIDCSKNREKLSQTPHPKDSPQESPVKNTLKSPASSLITQSCPPEVCSTEVDCEDKNKECTATNDSSETDEPQWSEELKLLPCGHVYYLEGDESLATCHCGYSFNLSICKKSEAFIRIIKYSL